MKALLCLMFVISTAFAQDPGTYLKNFDNKVYSLKNKGVTDFVVDIESTKLTKQMNDQQIFGKVKELVFRVYWTSKPERLAIEVMGLPEGFKEVKEELKVSLLGMMDNILPPPMAQRFQGYKFVQGPQPKEIIAQDTTGVAPIPSFVLKFDKEDKLTQVVGQRPIGTLVIDPVYQKESFSDNRLVLKRQITTSTEGSQTVTIKKDLSYGQSQGIGVLTSVEIATEQKAQKGKATSAEESLTFKNYKINAGEGLKYFLGEGTKELKKQ